MSTKPMSDPTSLSPNSARHSSFPPDEWVDRFGDYLYRYALVRVQRPNVAEELVQETLLAALQGLHRFKGDGDQRAWLAGILRRKIFDFFRTQARERRWAGVAEADISERLFDENGNWQAGSIKWAPHPDAALQSRELWQIVQDCLQRLPSKWAHTFTLSVIEQMDTEEMCELLEITPNNLWVRMHRARLALADCVGKKWLPAGEGSEHVE